MKNMELRVINKVTFSQPNIQKTAAQKQVRQEISFGAKEAESVKQPSKAKKGLILAAAAAVLALPIILCKIPTPKIQSLRLCQEKLKAFMQQTVKPMLDKLMHRTPSANAGLNIVR